MSGIEIAGVVLAVLPILIEAAKNVHERSKGKRASKESNFACGFRNSLISQQTLLSLYLKGVIGRTCLPSVAQRDLVSNPGGQNWRKPEVIQALRIELGEAYPVFEQIVSRVSKALAKHIEAENQKHHSEDEIAKLLQNLSLDSQQAADTQADKEKLWSRIKFRWSSSERNAILSELEQCNKLLRRLSSAVDSAKPYERSQKARRAHLAFKKREQMERIFSVLRKTCDCDLPHDHDMGLRLQRPPLKDDGTLESKFQILLFDSQQTIFKVSARVANSQGHPPPKKKICFSSSKGARVGPTSDLHTKNVKILKGICQAAKVAQASNTVLEVIVDSKTDVLYSPQSQNASSVTRTTQQPQNQQLVSLTEAISKLSMYGRKRWLNKDKLILAVTLSYSLLQLHRSSWLQHQWNSNIISFVEDCATSTTAEDLHQLRRPFTRSQASAAAAAHDATATISSSCPRTGANATTYLNSLGIILLELYLNRSIEADVLTSGTDNYCHVAQNLLIEHTDDDVMTPDYHRAVHFCLSPRPSDNMSYSFEDEGFRELYYTEVIRSLEEDANSKFEINESDWGEES